MSIRSLVPCPVIDMGATGAHIRTLRGKKYVKNEARERAIFHKL